VSSDEHRDVVRRYIRWQLQRRMNQMETVPHGTFLRSKQTVTVAIEFLNWLDDHGLTLEELRQEHLDAWLADGPSTRRFVDRFIPWAIKCRLVDPELTIAAAPSPKLSKSEQDAAVECVVHTDELTVRDRAAAILVIVFGQHIEHCHPADMGRRRRDRRGRHHQAGEDRVRTPLPLGRAHAPTRCRARDLTASHPNSNWVFRGYSPGRHIQGSSLRSRLKSVFGTRAARLGTLHELTKLGPVPIIADALGYHPSTIERHAIGSASTYAEYIAAARGEH
jgi:hypothetical protein